MFKTKGFSSNNSLKRRAVIVDAPDLPPEECEFYITSAGIADTDKIDLTTQEESELEFEIEKLYEDNEESAPSTDIPLTTVRGIGKGTAENLIANGISSVDELLSVDPNEISAKIRGISPNKVIDWQKSAKALLNS